MAAGLTRDQFYTASTPVLAQNLRANLQRRGHHVVLVTPSGKVWAKSDMPEERRNTKGRFADETMTRTRGILSFGPDILHIHGDISMCYYAAALKRLLRIPTVVTVTRNLAGFMAFPPSYPILSIGSTYGALHPIGESIKRRLIRKLDHIVVMNQYMLSVIGQGDQNVSVVRYGVRNDWNPKGDLKNPDKPIILYWGDGSTKRGFHTFLSWAEQIKASTEEILIMAAVRGIESEIVHVTRRAVAKGIIDNLWTRPLAADELTNLVASSWLTILPFLSNSAEPPLTTIESMAAGSPVVTTSVGGNPELVQDGVNGLLVAPNSSLGPERIVSAMEDKKALLRMSTHAREFVRRQFDWSTCVRLLEGTYESLLAR